MRFVCPRCKGPLECAPERFACRACNREYPVVCGIPDFRLEPDPYISIEQDRQKGELLLRAAETRGFKEMLRYYYSITPEVPPDLAAQWTAHSLALPDISRTLLRNAGLLESGTGALLDIGCSTAGLLAGAADCFKGLVGADVAFRWLVIGQIRLRELGVRAILVCANAEALPFPDGSFRAVTVMDVLEHVRDAELTLQEAHRVSAPGAKTLCTTNNRYAPLRDPQVGIWGVGYVPRKWQPAFVARRRSGMHYYHVQMRSCWELRRLFRRAGYRKVRTAPALLSAPHLSRGIQNLLAGYNRLRGLPLMSAVLQSIGPRLEAVAER